MSSILIILFTLLTFLHNNLVPPSKISVFLAFILSCEVLVNNLFFRWIFWSTGRLPVPVFLFLCPTPYLQFLLCLTGLCPLLRFHTRVYLGIPFSDILLTRTYQLSCLVLMSPSIVCLIPIIYRTISFVTLYFCPFLLSLVFFCVVCLRDNFSHLYSYFYLRNVSTLYSKVLVFLHFLSLIAVSSSSSFGIVSLYYDFYPLLG